MVLLKRHDSVPPQTLRTSGRRALPMGISLCWLTMLLCGCGGQTDAEVVIEPATPWPTVTLQATGKVVRMAMWDGDPMINSYMRNFVAPRLQDQHGVTLEFIGLRGPQLVTRLLVDQEAKRIRGDIDIVWINGETFYQLRRIDALFGPIDRMLPNTQLIDWSNPFIAMDFQQPVDGFECPWGNVQMTLIYNTKTVPQPPQTVEQLTRWIQAHPGRFTVDNSFTGMTFLKSLLIHFAGGADALNGPFDESRYQAASAKLWQWLRDLQPDLWREGRTFPEDVAQLHQLMNSGEVDFTMSNNDGEVDNKVAQGILPETAHAYVPEFGSIRNSHYLGIPKNAPNVAGALVTINFLIAPEAQLEKAKPAVWGDGTVLATPLLPQEWQSRFATIDGRVRVPGRDELAKRALAEPMPEVMIRLHEDFRREIIERGK